MNARYIPELDRIHLTIEVNSALMPILIDPTEFERLMTTGRIALAQRERALQPVKDTNDRPHPSAAQPARGANPVRKSPRRSKPAAQ